MTDIDILMTAIGMPDFTGRPFLTAAIELGLSDAFALDCITKWAYRDIARQFGVGYTTVERNMRHVIKRWWLSGGGNRFEELTGVKFYKRPANRVFLLAVVDVLRYQGVYVLGLI